MIRKIILLLVLAFSLCGICYALETREKITELNAAKTTIIMNGDEQTVMMEGPLDFSHEEMKLKANRGKMLCFRNPHTNGFEIRNLELNGSVEYSDNLNYRGTCAYAFYDFDKKEALFRKSVKITGNEMALKSDEIKYNTAFEKFQASGNVGYEGTAEMMSLLIEKEQTDKTPFSIKCTTILIDRGKGESHAEGDVKFTSLSTTIDCGEVYLNFKDNDIISISAYKDVRFADPEMKANAEIAIYDKANSTLTLRGGPSNRIVNVVYKGQEFNGREVIVDLSNGREITLSEGRFNITPDRK